MDEHVVGHGEQVTLHARGQRHDNLQQREIRLFIHPQMTSSNELTQNTSTVLNV